MRGRVRKLSSFYLATLACLAAALALSSCSRSHRQSPPAIDGAAIFKNKCASCHSTGNDMRAPEPAALREMSQSSVLSALETGRMKWEGKTLSKGELKAVSTYLGKPNEYQYAKVTAMCARDLDPPAHPPIWAGWGVDLNNTRFQSAVAAGLNRGQVKNLKLKWAFAYPGAAATFGQPTTYAGKLFLGSEDGTVYSLDQATGCIWWTFRASDTVKTAVAIGNNGRLALFGDTNGYVYAVNVSDGSLVWRVRPESHSAARITGSPVLVGSRLYVPISSGEEGAAADPHYPCCTFRGSLAALDVNTGKQIWKRYTIPESPGPTRKSSQGVQYYGPAGAAVWSPPTIDTKRHVIYVATGNNYSSPSTETSDAVVALNMETGKMLWHQQFTPRDLWNSGCVAEQRDSCPENRGDDYDFGAPPVLKTLAGGKKILLVAQKSGMVYALDPDSAGKILWRRRIGKGGPLGGIEWGGAADSRHAYYPLSDFDDSNPQAGGGLFALNLRTGKQAWYSAPPKPACIGAFGCSAAQMAPPTVIPGVVFAGSLDGHIRAYDSRNGTVIWDFNTAQEFHTTNGLKAHGGSINGCGPTIVGGMVFVNTGYTNAMDGNVVLAFSTDGR
jgi:polyvinyl alcohol dehydrogenase (cytochrome)